MAGYDDFRVDEGEKDKEEAGEETRVGGGPSLYWLDMAGAIRKQR